MRNALISRSVSLQLATFGFGLAVAGITFLTLPMGKPEGRFDLVQYHGLESDIIDTDQSAADCAAIVPRMQAIGFDVACENPISR